METATPVDVAASQQALARRQKALTLVKYRSYTVATLIPVWFALLLALLIAAVPSLRVNSVPYVIFMLAFAILGITTNIIRGNRRLDAAIELILQDAQSF
jgi:hypothetical protein